MAPFRIFPSRASEATADQLVATGAGPGLTGIYDPVDGDTGYRRLGAGSAREVPHWTRERAMAYSVAAYRMNPMARAIIDTYTSFCVGDSGVTLQCSSPAVQPYAERFWTDPRNNLGGIQEAFFRDHLLMGESVLEMLVAEASGITRFSVIDPARVTDVELERGNPLWPAAVRIPVPGANDQVLSIASVDDLSGLRLGQVQFWASFKALLTDRRGQPFLAPVIDWLDSYDGVISNLIDRTAIARYLVWDVTVDGTQDDVDTFIQRRGGMHVPRSGSVEVHNKQVAWDAKTADTGSYEDNNTARAVLTSVAGGAGLAKTWLADSEDANRATSLSMAEPVRRRVGGVQKQWLAYQTELARFAVDQAVWARRLDAEVDVDVADGKSVKTPAAQTVTVTGPEVAAADAQVTARVLLQLSQGLAGMVKAKVMSPEAAKVAAKKAWEDFVGVPYSSDLDKGENANEDDIATAVEDAADEAARVRRAA